MTAAISPKKNVTLVTRGSPLALWQADFVTQKLAVLGVQANRLIVKTTADRVQDRFLHEMGGKGLFVKELEEALLDGRADLAVHSLKDMPAALPHGFQLSAILSRHASTDLLIFRKEVGERLKPSAEISSDEIQSFGSLVVGTGSLRRQALLKKYAPQIKTQGVRGNVDTRLRKLDEGQWDALILAEASLDRLSLKEGRVVSRLSPSWFIPCAGQGALAIEARAHDAFGDWLRTLGDPLTTLAVEIERGVLLRLGGDCMLPFGCIVRPDGTSLRGEAAIFSREGDVAGAQHVAPMPKDLDRNSFRDSFIDHLVKGLKSTGGASIMEKLGLTCPVCLL
jgi:hydroxymethylbilane synthase